MAETAAGIGPNHERTHSHTGQAQTSGRTGQKAEYKEKQELENLPGRIEALEAEQAELQRKLSDPAIYKTEGGEVSGYTERLEALEAELEAVYARWEALEVIAGNS